MVKKLFIGVILAAFLSTCFAGYSSGGRSGYSGSSRGYSSSRSYSTARSSYARSSNTSRAYAAPRNYARSYSEPRTVIHNTHYSHGGGYGFGGNGFFNGFLGGYLGGSMANHHTTVIAGGTQGLAPGEGVLMQGAYPVANNGIFNALFGCLLFCLLILFTVWACVKVYRSVISDNHCNHKRW